MGLTPLEGVPMGTRSGCIDPAILEFIMNAESIDISEMTDILNKKSGVLGISGISSDFRDLDEAKDNGHTRAIIALECYAYSVKKYIGAYVAALGGLVILVFTAGIGENNYKARKEITSGLEFMGISIDDEKNINNQTDISAEGSRVRTLVVPTNEELAIAIDTMALVEKLVK